MRTLIAIFLSLLLAVVVTLWVKEDNGYVLIGYGHWTIEGSLALFLLADALLFLLGYVALRTLSRVWAMPERVSEWHHRRLKARAQHALTRGLVELAEGHWKLAEKHLIRYASQSETPLLNYLAAARAAQLRGEDARRDDYLHLAHESMPSAEMAVSLTQAELQLAHEQYEQALATLMHVRTLSPKHSYVLTLLQRLYVNLGEWEKLQELLPELHKRKAISDQEHRMLEIRVYRERLLALGDDPEALDQLWLQIPKSLRQEKALLNTYVSRLVELESGARAVALIADSLQQRWDSQLIQLYGQVEGGDVSQQLALAEGWLRDRPEDPDLLLALARLCLQNRLWGKARNYLEASIGIKPQAAAYQELGVLLEQMEEPGKALASFRAGLELERGEVVRRLPPINRAVLNHPPKKDDSPPPTLLQGV